MLIRELRVENEKKILHLMECNHLYSASETHFSKTMVRKYLDTKNCAGPSFFFCSFRLLTLSSPKLHVSNDTRTKYIAFRVAYN